MWLVTQQCHNEPEKTLFYADQSKVNGWWTDNLSKARVFPDSEHPINIWKKLKFNQPRVITFAEAQQIVAKQQPSQYTARSTKQNHDRQVPPVRRNQRPAKRGTQGRLFDSFEGYYPRPRYEPEYEHELDQLLGLDGWGAGGY